MKVSDIVSFSKEGFLTVQYKPNGSMMTAKWVLSLRATFSTALSTMVCRVSTLSLAHISFWILPPSPKILQTSFYAARPSNSFVMTIAGYGTGKSHLAVCLGALFSGDAGVTDSVIQNITAADAEIGNYIRERIPERIL